MEIHVCRTFYWWMELWRSHLLSSSLLTNWVKAEIKSSVCRAFPWSWGSLKQSDVTKTKVQCNFLVLLVSITQNESQILQMKEYFVIYVYADEHFSEKISNSMLMLTFLFNIFVLQCQIKNSTWFIYKYTVYIYFIFWRTLAYTKQDINYQVLHINHHDFSLSLLFLKWLFYHWQYILSGKSWSGAYHHAANTWWEESVSNLHWISEKGNICEGHRN